jgi:DNA-binding beta-propeller fold protein YncE
MRQPWTRASRPRLFLVVAAISVIALTASRPIYSAVHGSHVTRPKAASSVVTRDVILTASRFGKGAAESRPGKILVARTDGSGSRILTRGWYSFVSPDGSRIAVINSNLNSYTNLRLELHARAGRAPTRAIQLNCGRIVWSPDSTKLACVDDNGGEGKPSQLRLIDAATAAVTTLATGFFDAQVSFSPDSKQLAYAQTPTAGDWNDKGALKLIDLATRATTTVRGSGAFAPVWGPTAIAFSTVTPRGRNYTFNVALVQPNGSGFRQLTHFRPTTELYGPYPVAWSADGKRLLGGIAGLDAWTFRESYAIDPIRGGSRLIAHSVAPSAFSRDGRFVIGQTGDAETSGLYGSNVVRVPWVGGQKHVLLTISRDGRVVATMPPSSGSIDGLWPANGWQEGVKSVHVADLDGDHEPEIDVDLYTGGLHCCRMLWAYRWNGTMYVSDEMWTGSYPYTERDLNHDGRPEWVAADSRFEYRFTSFAGSGVPLRIYDYRRGTFLVVTSQYPALVRKDAARWWRIYQRQRSGPSHDSRGFLAAWAADKYLLGAGAKVWPALSAALRRGDLRGSTSGSPSGGAWPTGRAYISKLRQDLHQFGYLR